ncbi:MAG TPA: hypothetical protein VJT68_01680, partial [Thermoleophilaceae bacterium]|nr:hypothetical protein [Thermoleophilaceae bacterium]
RDLASAAGDAALAIEDLRAGRLAGLASALRSTESAYAGLARAIAAGDQVMYDQQREAVIRAEAAVDRRRAVLE